MVEQNAIKGPRVWRAPQGALALLDIETGVETLSEVEAGAAFLIMLFLTSAEPKPKRA